MPIFPEDHILVASLDPVHAAAIGTLASQWALLEHAVDTEIWKLAGADQKAGACITAQIGFVGRRFDALISLARLRSLDKGIIKKLNSIRAKATALADIRNRIVHDPWSQSWTTKRHYRLQITAKSELIFDDRPMSATDINKVTIDIQRLAMSFDKLRVAISLGKVHS